MRKMRVVSFALCVTVLAACGGAGDSIKFTAPKKFGEPKSMLGMMQIWTTSNQKEVLMLMKLPVTANPKSALQSSSMKDATIEKQEEIKICGNQAAKYFSMVKPQQHQQIEQPDRTARGRHAPPPEVRLPLQRRRLLSAAAAEFAERGHGAASATSIARRAGMSKATFYAHFANKEDCILALYDRANEVVGETTGQAVASAGRTDAATRLHAATRAYLETVAENPAFTRVLVVEVMAAGPKAMAKRDQSMQLFAQVLDAENAAAAKLGLGPRFASPHDAYAIVGAITELVSRQVRLGEPKDVRDLEPTIERLIDGVLARGS